MSSERDSSKRPKPSSTSNSRSTGEATPPTMGSLLTDLLYSFFDLDRGLPGTIWAMLTKPAQVVQAYMRDRHSAYFPPLRFVLITGLLYGFIWQFLIDDSVFDEMELDFAKGTLSEAQQEDPEALELAIIQTKPLVQLVRFSNEYMAYSTIIFLPFTALFTLLMFRRAKKNYLEHLVLNAYISGEMVVFFILFALPWLLISMDLFNLMSGFTALAAYVYFLIVSARYFNRFTWGFMLLYLLAFIVFSAITVSLFFLGGGIYVGYTEAMNAASG